MAYLTIRNLDPEVKAALEQAAATEAISQNEAARRALARGLGVSVRRRQLDGLGDALMGREAQEALSWVRWEAPDFSDEALDEMAAAATRRGGL